ncbi:MAG: murein biosynthesis integral membrane protein MurJ [Alphaproteobacteria bacterium]
MNLLRSAAVVGIYTLLSRILGFIRDLLIAATLGAGPVADAFFVAFRLPNLFRRLFAEGAFNAAFSPMFAEALTQRGPEDAKRFAEEALAVVLVGAILLTAIAELAMPALVSILAPGFLDDPIQFDRAVEMARLSFPYLGLMTLMALAGAVLNGIGRFAAAAAAPILLNIVAITALLGFADLGKSSGHVLAAAVTLSGAAQLAFVVFAAHRAGYSIRLRIPRITPSVKRLGKMMAPGVLAAGATQINIVVGSQLASLLSAGAISHLYYADRIYQLPLGVIGVGLGVALLPQLSREAQAGNEAAAKASLARAVEIALWLTLPATAAALAIPDLLVRALFERGAFTDADALATAAALTAYAAGLPAFVLAKTLAPAFFARADTKTPARAAGFSVVLNIALGLSLMWSMGHVGLALATTLAAWTQAMWLLISLMRRGWYQPSAKSIRRIVGLVCTASALAVALFHAAGPIALLATTNMQLLGLTLGLCIVGGLAYMALAHLIGAARIDSALREIKRGPAKT